MKVVNLGEARDLLAQWEHVRGCILRGEIKSFALCVRDWKGRETLYMAGQFKDDPEYGARLSMRMSWNMSKAENRLPMPSFAASTL